MRRTLLACLLAGAAGCASSGTAVPAPFPRPGSSPDPSASAPSGSPTPGERSGRAGAIVATALALQGVPYRDGGTDPSGFDCSGLVAYVFAEHGIVLPRTAAEQFRVGQRIRPASLRPGDLVFFSTVAPGASHVGIVVAPGEFVHAPAETGVVRVERLGARYWASRYVGARRVRP